ncbi:MAG TPA: enoyl-CoA hydratase/isomerase family protein [Stellaceae bacterium]|jgi:thioesterase DpgC|nr:enoyl-CoA hydratase/isomerase family protein [Stellaceae bacterium]
MQSSLGADAQSLLERAGLAHEPAADWLASQPDLSGDYHLDTAASAHFWMTGANLLAKLRPKPQRSQAEASAAQLIAKTSRLARDRFLELHVETLYRALTRDYRSFVRVEQLAFDAVAMPGLVPTREQVAVESQLSQRDKEGVEIDQAVFLSRVLAHPKAGAHLCHAMLLPTTAAMERLDEFRARGALDLGAAHIERRGTAATVTMRNPRFLNAEDESTVDAVETAVDLALLDPEIEIAVLRGGVVEHPKYRGRHVFSAGINLTHLYHGKISYLWYIKREMGFVNKLFRGLAKPEASPDEICGDSIEKPWVASVEAFAIGGGCQYLLATDYVVAASDAYLTLPARKEGIIPGAANLRLTRFVGDRLARQLIMYGRRLECDSPEGRLICDEVVPPGEIDAAIDRVVEGFTSSGVVSAAGNRRAFRVAEEPLDLFRRYMAVYAREQAYCHFSPALIANLERNWNAQQRRA